MLVSGARLGRYRLARLLGEGGMGVVWAATDLESGGDVALKLMKDTPDDAEARRRFLREARAATAVRHPNVVKVLAVFELDGGEPVMVMELLAGETLADRVRREGRLSLTDLATILMPVASAVGTAHALGIVHRDLKPENIYLSRGPAGGETVKVLDFGIAKLTALDGAAARSIGLTTGSVMGTPAYMSPEQVFGELDIDHRSDVWTFGLLTYQCLSGVLPTAGDNIGQILKNVVAKSFAPLHEVVPGLPRELSSLVERMLARDREERPADLQKACDVLKAYTTVSVPSFGLPPALTRTEKATPPPDPSIEREPGRAPKGPVPSDSLAGDGARAAPGPETPRSPSREPPPATPRARRSRGLWIAAAALVAAGVACFFLVVRPWIRHKRSDVAAGALASFSALPNSPSQRDPAERIALGRALFADPRLSRDGDVACTTCHPLDRYGADQKRLSRGTEGREPPRNTLSVYNVSGFFALLWDGRQDDLVEQAKEVLLSPRTMAVTREGLPEKLRATGSYASAFAAAFPGERDPITFDNTARALAAFEGTLFTRGRWDRFLEGDGGALSDEEKAGFNRFVEVGCIACHFGPNVGATMFQKAGLVYPWPDTLDKGRYEITKRDIDWMVFRVPSLRNVAATPPYFHDGSVASLPEAIRRMAHHQIGRELEEEDVAAIASWLGCLTGDLANPPAMGHDAGP